jgi:predicted DsbA family dithiol-disulfide isomerase
MIFAGRTALSGAESPERILYAIDKALEPPAP